MQISLLKNPSQCSFHISKHIPVSHDPRVVEKADWNPHKTPYNAQNGILYTEYPFLTTKAFDVELGRESRKKKNLKKNRR